MADAQRGVKIFRRTMSRFRQVVNRRLGQYAKNWREKCYEKLKNKQDKNSLTKLPIGSVIKFQNGRREITLYKHPAGYQFKRPFWILNDGSGYIPQKHIPDDFIVVKKGD